jgi:hypothetical protein
MPLAPQYLHVHAMRYRHQAARDWRLARAATTGDVAAELTEWALRLEREATDDEQANLLESDLKADGLLH